MPKVTDETGADTPDDLRDNHVATASGGPVGTETVIVEPTVDKNPNKEPEITVRVKPGFEFYHMGDLRKEGDPDFPMAITQARAASMMVDEVTPDGKLRAVPHEMQEIAGVPRANLAGRARHERIEALEAEKAELEKRLAGVNDRLKFENDAAEAAKKEPAAPPVKPRVDMINTVGPASPSPAFTPGTEGAPGTTDVPARPGEPATGQPGGTTPAANTGPQAIKK